MKPPSAESLPCSACVVLIRDGKIAAIRSRKHGGSLELPGGKAEPNETPSDNAIRECFEEVGVRVKLLSLLTCEPDVGGFYCSCYLAQSDDELVSSPEGEAVWVTPEEMLTGTYHSHTANWLPLVARELGRPKPADRVRPGLYRHYAPDSPPYVVIAVAIRDEHGHGDVDAPRDVIYHSTRSFESGLANSRAEIAFTQLVLWPDGEYRPRFIRIVP